MNKIGYHVSDNTVFVKEFEDILNIIPGNDAKGRETYHVILTGMRWEIVIYKRGDFIEYYGKRYIYTDMKKFCMEWRNIQAEKAIESL